MGDAASARSPMQRPWMMFVDGENLTLRAQEFAKAEGVKLVKGKFYEPDVFVWLPGLLGRQTRLMTGQVGEVSPTAVRAHFYTTAQGDETKIERIKHRLWELEFQPEVFKKPKGRSSKGVDITLARDMLHHAYHNNYDLALLVAGDADYAPLVEAVRRAGKMVSIAFFPEAHGLSPALKMAADDFFDVSEWFTQRWRAHFS